jgi:hypothetical protein
MICLAYPGPHGPMENEDNRAIYLGHAGGYLYAVLLPLQRNSPNQRNTYVWLGLYEWPLSVIPPTFANKTLMIA